MADSMKVQGPVEIKDKSAERVAFDLMMIINGNENPSMSQPCTAKQASKRLYFLNLYSECLNVVNGYQAPETDSSKG